MSLCCYKAEPQSGEGVLRLLDKGYGRSLSQAFVSIATFLSQRVSKSGPRSPGRQKSGQSLCAALLLTHSRYLLQLIIRENRMSLHTLIVPGFIQILRGLSAQLDKASAWAAEAGTSSEELMAARLTPDMLPLSYQVRFVCVQARDTVRQLTDQDIPAVAEDIAALDALKALIAETIALLDDLGEDDFNGSNDKPIELAIPNGMTFDLTGFEYARDWAQPQFYFHATTAYSIMRHLGVPLGKVDYVGHMLKYLRPAANPETA